MKVEIKLARSTNWNLMVRYLAKENANYCTSLTSFVGAFHESLKRCKRSNVGHISNAYKAEVVDDNKVEIRWLSPTKNETKLIAIVTL